MGRRGCEERLDDCPFLIGHQAREHCRPHGWEVGYDGGGDRSAGRRSGLR